MPRRTIVSFALLALSAGCTGGGGGSGEEETGASGGTAPSVSFSPSSITVATGQTGTSTLTASDDVGVTEGPTVTCTNGGAFSGDVFTAPSVTNATTSECTAVASDADGNAGEATLSVTVTSPVSVDLDTLFNYADQPIPEYINALVSAPKDNTVGDPITDEGATLGRVLFYDTSLSTTDTIACATCHQQENAFSDLAVLSTGVGGDTQRHSMRLINMRFAEEATVRWDETAASLRDQVSIPIRKAEEMGYSGENGDPSFEDLIEKLEGLGYYDELFTLAFGNSQITEERIQSAVAQFVYSIQSFDSRYDEGRAQVQDDTVDFPNFTAEENAGKLLFIEDFEWEEDVIDVDGELFTASRRVSGGLNCATCHRPPEFDIDPASLNNGFVRGAVGQAFDFTVTRSPTMRDLTKTNGDLNGGMFHAGQANNLIGLTAHYDFRQIEPLNDNLDPRMTPGGNPQWLDMTNEEEAQLFAFMRTLAGTDVYTNEKWSDPFSE